MARFKQEVDQGDGWSRWVKPVQEGYKMACCDCGLVHTMDFRIVRERGPEEEDEVVENKVSRRRIPGAPQQPLDRSDSQAYVALERHNFATSRKFK